MTRPVLVASNTTPPAQASWVDLDPIYATASQGAKADSALQNAAAFATAAQGAKADSALQSIPAGTTAATSATTGTMTVSMTTDIVTITPTGACTFNASGGTTGRRLTFAITTSGVSSFTLTFGTNFRKTGTLATGTTSARFFSATFICLNGTTWQEESRTAVQT